MDIAATPRISIIIPVYRESETINLLIAHLRRLDPRGEHEIVVVDGHPDRDTISLVTEPGVITLGSSTGRGRQMNAGAAVARGSTLLFLHADTYLPDGALARIRSVMTDQRLAGGAFDLAFDTRRRSIRLFARLESLRARVSRVPFGDQAIFLRKTYFDRIGGFADIPIMEDVDLMRRIKRRRDPIAILDDRVTTSSRRLQHEGLLYCLVRGGILLALYHLGVSPSRLKRFYKDCFRPTAGDAVRHGELSDERPVSSRPGLMAGEKR